MIRTCTKGNAQAKARYIQHIERNGSSKATPRSNEIKRWRCLYYYLCYRLRSRSTPVYHLLHGPGVFAHLLHPPALRRYCEVVARFCQRGTYLMHMESLRTGPRKYFEDTDILCATDPLLADSIFSQPRHLLQG